MAKKKERPLTKEELQLKIKTERTPHWFHSEPQFSLIRTANGSEFFTLTESAETQTLAVFLLDVGDYATERVLEIIDLWKERYKALGWKPVLVFQQKYLFIKNPKFFERYRNFAHFSSTAIYVDPFGEIHEWAKSTLKPSVLLMNQGKIFYKEELLPNLGDQLLKLEGQLQEALRFDDPGLPLSLLENYNIHSPIDHQSILAKDLSVTGQWLEGRGSVMTEDLQATATLPFKGKSFRLILDLHPQARENAKLVVTFNDQPLSTLFIGKNVKLDEKGNTFIDVNRTTGAFDIIESEQEREGSIKIFFSNVLENPIIFYEIRSA